MSGKVFSKVMKMCYIHIRSLIKIIKMSVYTLKKCSYP